MTNQRQGYSLKRPRDICQDIEEVKPLLTILDLLNLNRDHDNLCSESEP